MNLHWERRRILRQEKLNGGKKNLSGRRVFNRKLALRRNKPFLRGGDEDVGLDLLSGLGVRLILDAVANDETFWRYSGQWVDSDPANASRAAFIDAMTEKYTEGIQREDVKEAARAAIEAKVQQMEDENKANFECAEIDEIFTDPVNCAKPKEDEEEEAVDASDPQCCCTAGKGNKARRCSRQHKEGSPYCAQHANLIKTNGTCSKNGPTPLC